MRHLLQLLLTLSLILNGSGFLHAPQSHAEMAAESEACHGEAPTEDRSDTQRDCCAGSGCVCAAPSVAAVDALIARVPPPEHFRSMRLAQSGEPLCGPDSLLRPPIP